MSKSDWVRVHPKSNPCPICSGQPHRSPCYGLIAKDGTAAICTHVSDGSIKAFSTGAGYLHRLDNALTLPPTPSLETIRKPREYNRSEMKGIAVKAFERLSTDDRNRHATELGVSPWSLFRLRMGWSPDHLAYTFPMRDADQSVIGVRLRNQEGRKWAVRGSGNGIFIPVLLASKGPLIICAGPTDTAAMLDLDLDAIGRPSCNGGADSVCDYVRRIRPEIVGIIYDRDSPGSAAERNGTRGAQSLAMRLATSGQAVKLMRPPHCKDAREWAKRGVSQESVLVLLDSARYINANTTRP